jgi:membrane protease YdiL (CAAX protease family)
MIPAVPRAGKPSNYSLLFSYVLPYFLYVFALMLPESAVPRPAAYAVATGASALALAWCWRWYVPLRGPRSPLGSVATGVLAGIAGTALWLVIKAPFYKAGGEAWAPAAFWARLVASGTVVPIFEELLFRGLVLRGAVQWDRARRAGARDPLGETLHEHGPDEVEAGAWTPAALAISSLAFAAGHQIGEWPAAIAYGLLMAGLWVWRRDLLTPIVAHATTNVTLALWVRHTGQWAIW